MKKRLIDLGIVPPSKHRTISRTIMTPSIAVATDNIYKFACLFGLALIIAAVIAFFTTYDTSLNRKVIYEERIIQLEGMALRSPVEEKTLKVYRKLMEVTQSNETHANVAIGMLVGIGSILSIIGAQSWFKIIQKRDDLFNELQVQKLRAEVQKLTLEVTTKSTDKRIQLEGLNAPAMQSDSERR